MRFTKLTLGLILSFTALEAMASEGREPAHAQSCRLITGYGTTTGYGATKAEAEANAREICGNNMIDQYAAQRGSIPDSAVDDLALACINLKCQ